MNKFVCPECGGKIRFWNEYYLYKSQEIDPESGKLNSKVQQTKPHEANCGDMHGFECTQCNWSVNAVNGRLEQYKALSDLMDTTQFQRDCKV